MNAPAILTNVAVLLVVATLWTELKRGDRLKGPAQGWLLAAAALAVASVVVMLTV